MDSDLLKDKPMKDFASAYNTLLLKEKTQANIIRLIKSGPNTTIYSAFEEEGDDSFDVDIDYEDFLEFALKQNKNNVSSKENPLKGDMPVTIKGIDNYPPREFIIDRFDICKGDLVILCASGGSGKTLFAQHIATCVASGLPLLGKHPVKKGAVAHVDAEMDYNNIGIRYERLAFALELKTLDVRYTNISRKLDDINFDLDKTEDFLVDYLKEKTLCVFDSLKGVSGEDENSSRIETVVKMLKRVATRSKCVVLLIHHMGKGKSESKQSGRGSSAIYDCADLQIDLHHELEDVDFKLHCAKSRMQEAFKPTAYILKNIGTFIEKQKCTQGLLFEETMSVPVEDKDISILKYIKSNPGIKASDFKSNKEIGGGDSNIINNILKKLAKEGSIKIEKGPHNASLHTITDLGEERLEKHEVKKYFDSKDITWESLAAK